MQDANLLAYSKHVCDSKADQLQWKGFQSCMNDKCSSARDACYVGWVILLHVGW